MEKENMRERERERERERGREGGREGEVQGGRAYVQGEMVWKDRGEE